MVQVGPLSPSPLSSSEEWGPKPAPHKGRHCSAEVWPLLGLAPSETLGLCSPDFAQDKTSETALLQRQVHRAGAKTVLRVFLALPPVVQRPVGTGHGAGLRGLQEGPQPSSPGKVRAGVGARAGRQGPGITSREEELLSGHCLYCAGPGKPGIRTGSQVLHAVPVFTWGKKAGKKWEQARGGEIPLPCHSLGPTRG